MLINALVYCILWILCFLIFVNISVPFWVLFIIVTLVSFVCFSCLQCISESVKYDIRIHTEMKTLNIV